MIYLKKHFPCLRHISFNCSNFVVTCCAALCLIYVINTTILKRTDQSKLGGNSKNGGKFKFSDAVPNFVVERPKHVDQPHQIDEDVHVRKTPNLKVNRLPQRRSMEPCKPIYGRVAIFVAVVTDSYKRFYHVAQDSLKCYLKSTDYTFLLIDMNTDERVNKECGHTQLFFKKHCAAAAYLRDYDWLVVLDADTGVVNPNHCIEEWIDPRVDLVLYERFFNWEIASGNYIVRNSAFGRTFLQRWADWQYEQPQNWNGADNGVLQMHVLQTVRPEARAEIKACDQIWHRGTGYDTYMAYVTCVKVQLGAQRLWPGKLRLLRRAHGWVRDGALTGDRWCQSDFMLHGWKANQTDIGGWQSPFSQMFNVSECGVGERGWNWRETIELRRRPSERVWPFSKRAPERVTPKSPKFYPIFQKPILANVGHIATISSDW